MVYKAAWLKDRNIPNVMETSIAKLYGAKVAVHAANECMKLHGAFGYTTEYPCGRFLRDSKQFQTLEGTSNMRTMIVANAALGYAKNRVSDSANRPRPRFFPGGRVSGETFNAFFRMRFFKRGATANRVSQRKKAQQLLLRTVMRNLIYMAL